MVFTGQQPARDIPSFVQACDVLVSPRIRGTNTPLKIYSYLRSGKPILATNLLTHTQVLTPDIAVLVEPGPEAFAEALAALLDDPEARATLAARARAVAQEKYSRESYLRRTAQAYARLTSGAPGQASTSIPVAGQ
jgi:glycosyltransferase involved in cell wall biosynthesis